MTLTRRLMLASTLAAATPAFAAVPEAGPFEVDSLDAADLTDLARKRRIATRAYFPKQAGRYPVIIFSHGFGGSLNTFPNTGKIWASHGYVVLHPTHSDSLLMPDPAIDPAEAATMRKFREGRAGGPALTPEVRTAFVKLLDNPFYLKSRLLDVGFLQKAIRGEASGLAKPVLDRADTRHMGMSGHSFGAYTTLVIAGSKLTEAPKAPIPTGFAGYVSMSGQGPGRMWLTDDSFKGLTKPMLFTTGTRDFGAAGETPPWRLKPFDLSPAGRKYAAVVDGFTHDAFDPPPGDAKGAELRGLQLDLWRSVLKDEPAGYAALDAKAKASKQTDPVWLRVRV